MQAVWTHRFRSLLTILGIVIGITTVVTVASLLTGLRQGVVVFFQELGPDNIFLFKTSGDPSQDSRASPRSASAARSSRSTPISSSAGARRWRTWGWSCCFPPVVDGNPITARVPGYETDTINVTGRSPNMDDISPRDFAAGRFFTPEEDQRGAHVGVIGASVAEALFPDGHAVGRRHHDGWRGVHRHRRLRQGQGRLLRRERHGQRRRSFRCARRAEPLSADRPLHDHRQGQARQARRRPIEEVEGAMRRIRRLPTGADDDFAISTPDQIIQQFDQHHRADRAGGHRHLRRWACWWAASA